MNLTINNLDYKYSKKDIFRLMISKASFDFHTNLGIYGVSGSGKTTLGKIMSGLIENESINFSDSHVLYSAQMSENILLGSSIEQTTKLILDCNDNVRDLETKLSNNLLKFGMDYLQIKSKQGFELSAGELRKFAICLAISFQPDILILDEPSIGLDWQSRIELMKIIDQYKGKIILISHDYEMLKKLCTFLWVIDDGLLVFQGNFHQLEKNGKLCNEIGINIFMKLLEKRKEICKRIIKE